MCIKNHQTALNSTGILLLWYFHQHVSAGNPSLFRVLQEYSVIKSVKLLHNIETRKIIG